MSAPQTAIPFVSQTELGRDRACGAACLSMVYKSFGKEVRQSEIWPVIAKRNRFGELSSTTHLMAQDALNRGFAAVAIQARHPLYVLRLCAEAGVRAILSHRARRDAPSGHYSVLVSVEERYVVLHDPAVGPSRRMSPQELLELWQPGFENSEIAGNVLIAVAPPDAIPAAICELCQSSFPRAAECPQCKKAVEVAPRGPLGCVNAACVARVWNFICCPFCDAAFTFGRDVPPAASTTRPAESENPSAPPIDLNPVFAELDKFVNHIKGIPSAASDPDIKRYLEMLASAKEQLSLALVESLANYKVDRENLASMERARQQQHEQRAEELNQPSAPLDGRALGRALLKNLGFE